MGDIYDTIERIREEKNLSRRKLAIKAGINEKTLQSMYARRPEHFPSKYVAKIANALDVDENALKGEKVNCISNKAVRDMILRIVEEAVEKHDRYVTVSFFDGGPFVTVYPLTDNEPND